MTLAVIHCNKAIPWQGKRAMYFAEGLRQQGIPYRITDSRERLNEGFPILLGTTLWRGIEATGDYLLVDRCSFGDTDKFVSLVWNGHGRRGDHRVPDNFDASRWERHGVPIEPWKTGKRVVLCGQTETYSPHYRTLNDFYSKWYQNKATHFRKHPAGENPTGLPETKDFHDSIAVTLNSSIAVQSVMQGVPTITMDEASMAWDVTGHKPGEIVTPDRERWCHWLAWTQWTDDEIIEGIPWAYHL